MVLFKARKGCFWFSFQHVCVSKILIFVLVLKLPKAVRKKHLLNLHADICQ